MFPTVRAVPTDNRTVWWELKKLRYRGRDKKFVDGINIRLFNLLRKYYGNEKTASIFIKYEPPRMKRKGYR